MQQHIEVQKQRDAQTSSNERRSILREWAPYSQPTARHRLQRGMQDIPQAQGERYAPNQHEYARRHTRLSRHTH
jgi:hypothetical protein